MPSKSALFNKLIQLQQQISVVQSIDGLQQAVLDFIQQQSSLGEAVVLVDGTAVAVETAVAQIPISGSDKLFAVLPPADPKDDDITFLELLAAMVAASPLWQQAATLRPAQETLIFKVGEVMARQQRLAVVKAILTDQFSDAFPQATGVFYLVDRALDKLVVQAVLGQVSTMSNLEPLSLQGTAAQVMETGTAEIAQEADGVAYWLPIPAGDQIEGLFLLKYAGGSAVPLVDQNALQRLAQYIGVVISNQRLLEQSWHRANQLETIYSITNLTREKRPITDLLQEIGNKLHFAFNVPIVYIALYNSSTQLISFPIFIRNHEVKHQEPVSILDDKSMVAWVVANNRPYTTGDWHSVARPVIGINETDRTQSLMILPLRAEGEVIGAISLQSFDPEAFDTADLQTLMVIADHVSLLVKNDALLSSQADLTDKSAQDYQVAVALRQAIAVISTSLDQKVILDHLLVALGNVVRYDTAHAFLLDDGLLRLMTYRDFYDKALPYTIGWLENVWQQQPLNAAVMDAKEPMVIADTETAENWPEVLRETAVKSWMGVPLVAGGQILGILHVERTIPDAFNDRAVWLASSLCAHAAVALQNARLYQRTQQQLSELNTLYQASATMTANLDQDFVLQTVAKEMLRVLDVDTCSIFVWNENQQQLSPAAHRNRRSSAADLPLEPQQVTYSLGRISDLASYPFVRRVLNNRDAMSLRLDNATNDEQRQLLQAADMKTLLLVPLVRRKRLLGLMALGQASESRQFGSNALRMAQDLAGQASVAIEHAYLFAQAQRRIEELATFHKIVLQLNTPLKLSAVLDAITESALNLINATNLHIFLYDADRGRFTFGSALWDDGRREPAVASLRPEGLTSSVVRLGRPIVINDASNHPLFSSGKAASWGIHAIAGFPLKYGEQVIGAFTVTYLRPHTFTKDELLLLNLLADQASVAVRNARLFAESQRRLMDMSALVEMAKQVTGKLKLESVLQTTVQMLRDLMNARASTITMLSEDKTELVVQAAAGANPKYVLKARMKLGEGISGRVVKRCEMVYIRDAHNEPDFLFFDEVVRSLLAVPLIVRDEAIGTLTIDSDQPNAFSDSDIQLMTIAAAQASVAIANAGFIEELEQRAQELTIAYDELKESDRLKDELVQNVSHELRTPLTFVKGYVDLLMDGEMGLLGPPQMDALQIVADKTDEITRIIEDIITLQRIDASNLQVETLSLAHFLDTAVAGHRLVANQKGLQVVYHRPQDSAMAHIDRQRMQQVVNNLINNAMKFSPDGGTITVQLEVQAGIATVSVADQGIGVPKEKQDRIFDRFYQVDGSSRRRFGGTGIGLAIVKRIVNAHQGRVWVESEVQKGSTFSFTLPLITSDQTDAAAADETAVIIS